MCLYQSSLLLHVYGLRDLYTPKLIGGLHSPQEASLIHAASSPPISARFDLGRLGPILGWKSIYRLHLLVTIGKTNALCEINTDQTAKFSVHHEVRETPQMTLLAHVERADQSAGQHHSIPTTDLAENLVFIKYDPADDQCRMGKARFNQ